MHFVLLGRAHRTRREFPRGQSPCLNNERLQGALFACERAPLCPRHPEPSAPPDGGGGGDSGADGRRAKQDGQRPRGGAAQRRRERLSRDRRTRSAGRRAEQGAAAEPPDAKQHKKNDRPLQTITLYLSWYLLSTYFIGGAAALHPLSAAQFGRLARAELCEDAGQRAGMRTNDQQPRHETRTDEQAKRAAIDNARQQSKPPSGGLGGLLRLLQSSYT